MNICLLNDSFPPLVDGVANTVVNYANILNNRGNKAMVVTPEVPNADDSSFDYEVVRYSGLDLRKHIGYVAGNPFSREIAKSLNDNKIELLHSHCPFASTIVARSFAGNINAPIILTYHSKFDVDIDRVVKNRLTKEVAYRAIVDNVSACDEVWTVSKGAGENLKSLGYQGDYIVMENGVDMPKGRLDEKMVKEYTKRLDVDENIPVYLFVGRLLWYKGIKIILDALAGLAQQGYDFRMVFIGSGGQQDEIIDYTNKLKLSDKVLFLGLIYDREELRAWYSRADLFLFPSTYDTNGLVVREAAASSLPSVLIKDSCAAENVVNNTNGFLIDENPASLAVCLVSLQEHKDRLLYVKHRVADDLYISWQDAVEKAEKRYQIVLDNYHKNIHKKIQRPTDEFYAAMGSFLEEINKTEDHFDKIKGFMERYF